MGPSTFSKNNVQLNSKPLGVVDNTAVKSFSYLNQVIFNLMKIRELDDSSKMKILSD